jgi:hypothetical protein
MAVAFDAVGPSSAGTSSLANTALSWSHTCTGSNLCLIVGVGLGANPDTALSMTATYNGVAMTSLGVVHSGGSNGGIAQLWRLVAPATGAHTVAIAAAGGTPISLEGGSVSYTGVNQTTPVGTPVTASSQTGAPSVTVTGTTAGNMVAGVAVNGNNLTASGNTGRWLVNASTGSAAGNAAGADAAAGGSVALSWTATADWWATIGVELLADTGAATVDAPLWPQWSPGLFRSPGRSFPQPWLGTGADTAATLTGDAVLAATATVTAAGAITALTGATLAATATVSPAGSLTLGTGATLAGTATVTTAGTRWGPPLGLIATPISDTQIDLSWSAVAGASGYDIDRNGVVIATDVVGTTYSDTGLNPGTTYTYRARSIRS